MTKTISLPLPDTLLAEIDSQRGDVPRVRWIRAALELALTGAGGRVISDPSASKLEPGLKRHLEDRAASRQVEPRFKK